MLFNVCSQIERLEKDISGDVLVGRLKEEIPKADIRVDG